MYKPSRRCCPRSVEPAGSASYSARICALNSAVNDRLRDQAAGLGSSTTPSGRAPTAMPSSWSSRLPVRVSRPPGVVRYRRCLAARLFSSSRRCGSLLADPELKQLEVRLFDPVEGFDVAPHVIVLTGTNHEEPRSQQARIQYDSDESRRSGIAGPDRAGSVALADRARGGEPGVTKGVAGSAPPASSSFAGFRFPRDVIVLAVRWYLRYGLSYRDVEELLAERGVDVDHVTVYRWVQRFTPLLIDAARPCRHAVGDHWFVDETYVKVGGVWRYVYGRSTSSASHRCVRLPAPRPACRSALLRGRAGRPRSAW